MLKRLSTLIILPCLPTWKNLVSGGILLLLVAILFSRPHMDFLQLQQDNHAVQKPQTRPHVIEQQRHNGLGGVPSLPSDVHFYPQPPESVSHWLAGIDVSHYQGEVYWQTVQNIGVDFAFIKATEGIHYRDPTYFEHATALQNSSIYSGAYHFFLPAENAIQQAKHFVKTVKQHQHRHQLAPVLDIEITQGQTPQAIKAAVDEWLEYVEDALNCRPVIYTDIRYWQTTLAARNDYPLWLAEYASQLQIPDKQKSHLRVWQYSNKGRVTGVQHVVDLNLIDLREQTLEQLLCEPIFSESNSL